MPSSSIFSVDRQGRVFVLHTDNAIWHELPYLGVDFKRVCAHDHVVWALGGDHQIYVYVYGTSVPIRVCEESYENQRWNPLNGFTENLLPTDRPSFSNADGLEDKTPSDVKLPTLGWNWEGPWHLQDTFEGRALDKECWTYSVDFPRQFTAEKHWNSCVRRRKWIRYRRYIALDTWSAVPSIHMDHTEEPFIDISVGGGDVLGQDPDHLMVWGVTALGKVIIRQGTYAASPEGSAWLHISTPDDKDVTSVSVGRTGRVWAVTWDGCVIVRIGVSRENPTGLYWVTVEPPDKMAIHHIAVGASSVWAVCRDWSVWFRRFDDYNNDPNALRDNSTVGYSWLPMIGHMLMLSIGPNDQVWGIMKDDHSIVLRSGISKTDLTGKTWKPIHLPMIKFDPENSKIPDVFYPEDSSPSDSEHETSKLIPDNDKVDGEDKIDSKPEGILHDSEEIHCKETFKITDLNDDQEALDMEHEEQFPSRDFDESTNSQDTVVSDTVADFVGPFNYEDGDIDGLLARRDEPALPLREDSFSETASLNDLPVFSTRTRLHSNASSIDSEMFLPKDEGGSIRQEEDSITGLHLPEENLWCWMSGGGCWVQNHNLPKWFSNEVSASKEKMNEPWQRAIMEKLQTRRQREIDNFTCYEEALEYSSWTIPGQCRYLVSGQWVPASIELHMVGSKKTQMQEASLRISYTLRKRENIVIPCCSIVLTTLTVDLPAKSVVSLYTPSDPLVPLPLLFSAEKDAEEWMNHISSACIQFRGSKKILSSSSIWAVSSLGDIYVHDFSSSEIEVRAETIAANRELDIDDGSSSITATLERGFRPGCFITILATANPNAKKFTINLRNSDSDSSDIVLHINPRFDEKAVVFNNREGGYWKEEERCQISSLSRGTNCEITLQCTDRDIKILVNNKWIHSFAHRKSPSDINCLNIHGDLTLTKVTYNYGAGDRTNSEFFWRNVGGHLNKIETGASGVTWGLSYDSHVYIYTGTFKKELFKGSSNELGIYVMSDVRHFYVWENQRWNPLTGFTNRGLPTDRYSWSDQTGRHQKIKEKVKLPSRHWQWTSDWLVDHHTPDGVDKDGWQYATDFPAMYHSYCYATDLVRRRRWLRKSCISTNGPWKEMEKVSLISVSVSPEYSSFHTIPVWGVSISNEVVLREGVTAANPSGTRWTLIPSESRMVDICASIDGGVWAVCKNGQAHVRIGVTEKNPKGSDWVNVDAPDIPLKQVSSGKNCVWAVDREGGLYYRLNVQPLFPEGTEWQKVFSDVKCISISSGGILWAVLSEFHSAKGVLVKRAGINAGCPTGTHWEVCAGTGWSLVSCRNPSEHGL